MAKTNKPTPAKKTPANKSEKSAKPAAPAAGSPRIDTSLAAENAARLLVAKLPTKSPSAGTSKESSTFKNLKSGLSKTGGNAMSNLLDKTGGPVGGGSHQNFGHGQQQVGRNQTFGADVNRTGVPRRTGGG